VDKYRRRWAAPEARLAEQLTGTYDGIVVVPALRERPELLDGIGEAAVAGGRVLGVVVVNSAEGATERDVESNSELLRGLVRRATRVRSLAPGAWVGETSAFDLLVIDRNSVGRQLPRGQGVGLARRIGCDLALEMYVRRALAGGWVATTDADATLPRDYFTRLAALDIRHVAATFPFRHVPCGDRQVDALTLRYEDSLRYHLLGLADARSPYAFHTLGSCIAVRPEAYAMAHGFPERLAAEDFYLLGKVAKLGCVARLGGEPVRISSRESDRAPFGTGRAVRRGSAEGRIMVCSPQAFSTLSAWLGVLDRYVIDRDVDVVRDAMRREALAGVAAYLQGLDPLHELPRAAAQCATPAALSARLHTWFDSFRTLKLLHAARESGALDVELDVALSSAPFLGDSSDPGRLLVLESRLGVSVGPTCERSGISAR